MSHKSKLNRNSLVLAICTLSSITLMSGLVLTSTFASADDVVDNVSITVPISCSMAGTISSGNEHTAEIANGTYQANIGTTSIKTLCNDNAGFSIYAIGYTGDSYTDTNHTKLVGTSASSNATIDTGTATTAGNPDVSNWAMKLSTVTSPAPTYPITITSDTEGAFSNYHTIPATYTKVATRTAGTDTGTNAEGATLTTTYAAYISKTQAADTYTGKVKYVLVHPNTETPPVAGSFDAAYANAGKTKLNGYYKMQDMNPAICLAVTLEDDASSTTLIDLRDNKTYMVSKLKDGNCWMTQNLDLDLDSETTYTSADTDILANWTPAFSTYVTSNTTWNYSYTTPESYDPGDLYWNGDTGYYYNKTDCEAADGTWDSDYCNLIVSTGDSHYHLGNYYNWTAAVAMNDSSNYDGHNEQTGEREEEDVNQSICPANWTLPKSGDNTSSGSFEYLVTQYGWDFSDSTMTNPNIWNTAIKSVLAGIIYNDGYARTAGHDGAWWSSVVYDDYDAFHLRLIDDEVWPGDGGNSYRKLGFSIRCIAR